MAGVEDLVRKVGGAIVRLLDEQPVACALRWFAGESGIWRPCGESVWVEYLRRRSSMVLHVPWPPEPEVVRAEICLISPSDGWLRLGGASPGGWSTGCCRRVIVTKSSTVVLRVARGQTVE